MITVVGLGRVRTDETVAARAAIKDAEVLVVRSYKIPVLTRLKRRGAISMDALYSKAKSFSELDALIADELMRLEQGGKNVVYCVDGDGFTDSAVKLLYEKTDINIVQGVSDFGERMPSSAMLALDAYTLKDKTIGLDTCLPLSVRGIDSALLAGEVKLILLEFYSPSTQVYVKSKKLLSIIELSELDRLNGYGADFCIYIDGDESFDKQRYCFYDLVRIIERLTAPNGCEWDKAQTHQSIRINLIEEAYEAVEAIDSGDIEAMIEETGDVMLQSVLHADIAKRSGEYNVGDIIDALCKKLVSRHTHIFGTDKALSATEALGFWEAAKVKQKQQNSLAQKLDSVPKIFPATLKAAKVVSKARKDGMGLDSQEINAAMLRAISEGKMGKVLLYCIALSSLIKQDAEVELNALVDELVFELKKSGTQKRQLHEIVEGIVK